MEIVIAENHWYESKPLAEEIQEQIHGAKLVEIGTEHGLMIRLAQTPPPDILIIGTSLRWTDPAPIIPDVPMVVLDEGPYRAGMRVLEFLAGNPALKPGVIVRWNYLDEWEDEQEACGPLLEGLGVRFLPKTGDMPGDFATLFSRV